MGVARQTAMSSGEDVHSASGCCRRKFVPWVVGHGLRKLASPGGREAALHWRRSEARGRPRSETLVVACHGRDVTTWVGAVRVSKPFALLCALRSTSRMRSGARAFEVRAGPG